MDNIRYTELECIYYCIGRGFKGAEKRLESYNRLGRLDGKESINSLIKDMGIDYMVVELELGVNGKPLRGINRRYIATGKRDDPKQRIYNHKGRQPTKEDRIMDSYIFNFLISIVDETNTTPSYSYTGWTKRIKMLDTMEMDNIETKEMLNLLYKERISDFVLNQILFKFKSAIKDRNWDIVERGFKRLEKDGKIKLDVTYLFKMINGKYKIVSKQRFESIELEVGSALECFEVDSGSYRTMKEKQVRSEFEKEVCDTIKNILKSYGIEYYYKTRAATILDYERIDGSDKKDFDAAYIKRFKFLTRKRHRDYITKNQTATWQIHYLLNTFSLLKSLGFKGLDITIEDEKGKIPEGFGIYLMDLF